MSHRAPLALLPLLALSVAASFAPRAAHAQLLAGMAVDGATRAPAVGLPVRLLRLTAGAEPAVVDSGITHERGIFQIAAPGAGVYQLEFGLANRRATRGPVDTVAADAQVQREYALPITSGGVEAPYLESEVQTPVRHPRRPAPLKVPDSMRRGVAGEAHYTVVSEFVVDAQGRAEPGSFRVVSTTALQMVDAVRQSVQATRYTPATIGGIPVRQLLRHPVVWSVRSELRVAPMPGESP